MKKSWSNFVSSRFWEISNNVSFWGRSLVWGVYGMVIFSMAVTVLILPLIFLMKGEKFVALMDSPFQFLALGVPLLVVLLAYLLHRLMVRAYCKKVGKTLEVTVPINDHERKLKFKSENAPLIKNFVRDCMGYTILHWFKRLALID